jgi:hypothetical protein
MRFSIGLLAVLVCATGAWAVTDDFGDNSPGPGWTTGTNLVEQNTRLEFVHGSTGEVSELWTWGTQMSYTSNWSVALDMTTSIDPDVLSGDQWAMMGLRVANGSDATDLFRLEMEAGSSLENGPGEPAVKYRELIMSLVTNDEDYMGDESEVALGGGNDSASLLISYSAATHTLLAQYDLGQGSGLETLGSFDVVNGTANTGGWEMSGSDTFQLLIYAESEGLAMTSGLIHGDNFDVVPEPASMGLLTLGAIALLRRKRKT